MGLDAEMMSSNEIHSFEGEAENDKDFMGIYIGGRNNIKQRHGKGWAIFPNGDQYDGDYVNGQRHGIGLYVFQNGARYLGQYRRGQKSGKGIFFYPDGSIYDGNWQKNLRHGSGIYTYANEDIYDGNWHKGLRHGLGCYIFKNETAVFRGTWIQGIPVGSMEIDFQIYKYHGNYDYQYPQGPGIFSFMSKYMLSGYYKSESINLLKEEIIEGNDIENISEKFQNNKHPKLLENVLSPPLWYSQTVSKYDFSKLPQKSMLWDLSDSEYSTCDFSFNESEINEFTMKEPEPFEQEECETECEPNASKSIVSTE
ncbi:radial spoke head 1 homolog [Condylostylus longicornis]|uniref:radial spoke head 1 homolog n=1 Tax=Condylostylus longicornis TaxID=2530218 RepID=UPI00244E4FD1|nr:radial spoke head 1 homolog [Condylostylus longicornis]